MGRLFLFPIRQSVYSANFLIFRLAYSAEREDFFFSQFGNRYRVRTFLFFDSHTPSSRNTFFVLFQMPSSKTSSHEWLRLNPPKRWYFRALCRIRLRPYSKYEQSRLRQKSSKIATFWLPASIAPRLSLKTRRKTEVRIILGWHRKCSHSAYMKRNSKKPSHSAEKI